MKLFHLARIACVLAVFTAACVSAAPEGIAANTTKTQHHHAKFHGWQCATYVRLITPILLRGNAWTWWKKADGLYTRGNEPKIGAVMVFKRTKVMPMGHVAVVRRIVSDREVWIEHANWGMGRDRGRISIGDRVIDVSPNNDWTDVRVWSVGANDFGRVNDTYGFIYSPDYDQRTGIQWEAAEDVPGKAKRQDS
jgi:hypothetical protein